MKTFFGTRSNRAVLAAAIVALLLSVLAIHAGIVQGKASIIPAAGTTPVIGATLTLSKVQGLTTFRSVTATTDAQGNFTISNLQHGFYNMTITPAVTFTTSGRGVLGSPFQAWANFNMARGLLVADLNASVGATGPIAVMSNGSLRLSLTLDGPISGTLTK